MEPEHYDESTPLLTPDQHRALRALVLALAGIAVIALLFDGLDLAPWDRPAAPPVVWAERVEPAPLMPTAPIAVPAAPATLEIERNEGPSSVTIIYNIHTEDNDTTVCVLSCAGANP